MTKIEPKNIKAANEAIDITKSRQYMCNGRVIRLPDIDYSKAYVYSPEDGRKMLDESLAESGKMCSIVVTNEDSFGAASRYDKCMVMNFSNAYIPGGGFLVGCTTQEEALCRCSTLYSSLTSGEAQKLYSHNIPHFFGSESDGMIYSEVCVFKDVDLKPLEKPFVTGVITVPAPSRKGPRRLIRTGEEIGEIMKHRIRIMLRIAQKHGRRNLVLGAWGCGDFGNDPVFVSEDFRQVIVDERYGEMFDEICFAIFGKNDRNITAFRHCFENRR